MVDVFAKTTLVISVITVEVIIKTITMTIIVTTILMKHIITSLRISIVLILADNSYTNKWRPGCGRYRRQRLLLCNERPFKGPSRKRAIHGSLVIQE